MKRKRASKRSLGVANEEAGDDQSESPEKEARRRPERSAPSFAPRTPEINDKTRGGCAENKNTPLATAVPGPKRTGKRKLDLCAKGIPLVVEEWDHHHHQQQQQQEVSTSYDSDFTRVTVRSALASVIDVKSQTAWVAYLKESESKQVGQAARYQRLPHVMYRPTYLKAEEPHKRRTRNCLRNQLFPAVACIFWSRNQKVFREYILNSSQRLEFWKTIQHSCFLRRTTNLAQLFKYATEHAYIILHYVYNSDTLLEPCTELSHITESDIQIVINCRRCLTSTKEINKFAKCVSEKMKVSSLGLRMDLFLSQELRARLPNEELSSLISLIGGFEKKMASEIQDWNVILIHEYLLSLERRTDLKCRASSFTQTTQTTQTTHTTTSASGIEEGDCTSNSSGGEEEEEEEGFDAKSLNLKSLICRVNCLSRKVNSADVDSIVLRIREAEHDFVTRNKLSKEVLYLTSSMIALLLMDRHSFTKGGNYNNFESFHLICRSESRDSFEYEMVQRKTICCLKDGNTYMKTDFYFPPDSVPDNYKKVLPASAYDDKEGIYPAGVTTYTDFFNGKDIQQIEKKVVDLEEKIKSCALPNTCFHHTIKRNCGITRTKTFFGARYLWTKDQMMDSESDKAAGIRVDVPRCPKWISELVQKPLEENDLLEKDFMNSAAINIYHDGSEGIQSHFDDDKRFARPVLSLRTFSDSRLSFGTSFYGYLNGTFYVPMPRGCITVMEEAGYAANGIKHSVRPADMTGKSTALILRHVHSDVLQEAHKIHLEDCISDLKVWKLGNKSEALSRSIQAKEALASSAVRSALEREMNLECIQVVEEVLLAVEKKAELEEREKSKKTVKSAPRHETPNQGSRKVSTKKASKHDDADRKACMTLVSSLIRAVQMNVRHEKSCQDSMKRIIKMVTSEYLAFVKENIEHCKEVARTDMLALLKKGVHMEVEKILDHRVFCESGAEEPLLQYLVQYKGSADLDWSENVPEIAKNAYWTTYITGNTGAGKTSEKKDSSNKWFGCGGLNRKASRSQISVDSVLAHRITEGGMEFLVSKKSNDTISWEALADLKHCIFNLQEYWVNQLLLFH